MCAARQKVLVFKPMDFPTEERWFQTQGNNLVKLFRRANKTKVGRDPQGLLPRESILKFHDQKKKKKLREALWMKLPAWRF